MFISFLKNIFFRESCNGIDALKKRHAQGLELLENLKERKQALKDFYKNRKAELENSEKLTYQMVSILEYTIKESEKNKDEEG